MALAATRSKCVRFSPGRIGMVDELEVGFVHQRRSVERVVFALEIYHLLSTSRKTALIGLFSGIPTDKPP